MFGLMDWLDRNIDKWIPNYENVMLDIYEYLPFEYVDYAGFIEHIL